MNEVMERPAQVEITPEQLELIKRTVAKDATNDELKLYFYDCQRRGVHPLDKKIHFTKRGGKYVPIVGIDFLREQAAKTGECVGISDPAFSGKVGAPDFAATVTVKRLVHGHIGEFTATARWSEYCPATGQDHMWKKMPHTMLGKCSEALSLRKAFPGDEMGRLYITEEMDQAKDEPKALVMQSSFPPGQLLSGLFLAIIADQGTADPPKAQIQTLDGTFNLEIYGDPEIYRPLLGKEIEYSWVKKGPRCVLKEMYLKPMPKVEAQAEKPVSKPKPPIEEKDPHLRALVLSVEAVAKPGKKPYTKFELGFPDGSSKFAEYWGSEADIDPSLADFKDLEGSDVFFHMDSREFKGKNYYTIHDVFMADAYEEAMEARSAQEEANR